jgi:hypothetical protein
MQAQLKQQQQPAPHHANGVENGSNGHSKWTAAILFSL